MRMSTASMYTGMHTLFDFSNCQTYTVLSACCIAGNFCKRKISSKATVGQFVRNLFWSSVGRCSFALRSLLFCFAFPSHLRIFVARCVYSIYPHPTPKKKKNLLLSCGLASLTHGAQHFFLAEMRRTSTLPVPKHVFCDSTRSKKKSRKAACLPYLVYSSQPRISHWCIYSLQYNTKMRLCDL